MEGEGEEGEKPKNGGVRKIHMREEEKIEKKEKRKKNLLCRYIILISRIGK